MKAVFKFTVIALGIAAVALSVVAIANYLCRDKLCFSDMDDDFEDFDEIED